jgi:hypothetical protein
MANRRIPRATPAPVAAACAGAALGSLLLPFVPVFDPWAWLVWGREVAGPGLDTSGGPSWKPLPVLITTPLAILGDAAPDGWLVLARFGWLAAAALAWRLAARLARKGGRRGAAVAGAIAALGVVLLSDPLTPWLRQFAGGLSEPLLAALVLAAADRHLDRRHGQAFALWVAASMLRPEAWPFMAVAGWLAWSWATPRSRAAIAAATALVAAAWLVPDLLGSGDALTGADRARVEGAGVGGAWEALERAAGVVLVALWVGAAIAVATALRRGERSVPAIAAGAVAWIAIVAAMGALGFAGLARFLAPAGAAVCVLGGVGLVQGASAMMRMKSTRARSAAVAAFAAVATGLTVQAAMRAAELPGAWRDSTTFAHQLDELFALVDDVGRERLAACGDEVYVTDLLVQTALAWRLELPLDDVVVRRASVPRSGAGVIGPAATRPARRLTAAAGEPLGRSGPWAAYAVSCESGRRIAGVSGARR